VTHTYNKRQKKTRKTVTSTERK